MKDTILNIIKCNDGIKAVKLVMKVMETMNPAEFEIVEYYKVIDELVRSGQVKELQYRGFGQPGLKSIYFTKDTNFISLRGFADGTERSLTERSSMD